MSCPNKSMSGGLQHGECGALFEATAPCFTAVEIESRKECRG